MVEKPRLDGSTVVVLGGGAIGAAAAVRLQGAGARVTLVDPGDERARASYGNAGLIANELSQPLASWATLRTSPGRLFAFGGPLDFRLQDIGAWAPWALRYLAACRGDRFRAGSAALDAFIAEAAPAWRRLAADIGRPELVEPTAHWGVWRDPRLLAAGVAAAKAGSSSAVEVRELAAQELEAARREVCPRLAGGVAFEGSTKLTDPNEAVRALHGALAAGGGEVVEGRAARAGADDAGAQVELEDARRLAAGLVLVAAGAQSAPLVRRFGLTAPLLAERGYHLQYAEHEVSPGAPPMIFEDCFVAVVRVGEALRVTSFTEFAAPGSPPDPRKWARLERHVAELGLPVRGVPSRWMGERPTLPDFLPAIGRRGRLLYAFGHQHIGMTLAAATAEAVVEMARSDQASERLRPFALERFG
jgi:D-amino-acid dehydrogenase